MAMHLHYLIQLLLDLFTVTLAWLRTTTSVKLVLILDEIDLVNSRQLLLLLLYLWLERLHIIRVVRGRIKIVIIE